MIISMSKELAKLEQHTLKQHLKTTTATTKKQTMACHNALNSVPAPLNKKDKEFMQIYDFSDWNDHFKY